MNNTQTNPKDLRGFLVQRGPEALRKAASKTVPYNFNGMIMPLAGSAASGDSRFAWTAPPAPPAPPPAPPAPPAPASVPPLPPPAAPPVRVETVEPVPLPGSPATGEYPVEEDDRPPFPMDCIPGAAGVMAREIARVTTSQNEPLAAASILGVLSASLGAGITLNNSGERWTRPNLFLLPVADSGTGKGEAFSLAAAPIEAVESEMLDDFDRCVRPGLVAKLAVADARSKTLCKEAAREEQVIARNTKLTEYQTAELERSELQRKIDSAPRLKVADTTKEALAIIMQSQPGEALASLSSEARGILSIVKGRYGKSGGDEEFYCSAYSGDSITVDRVGRPNVTLRRPCLTALWMLQPDALRDALCESALTDSGFLPRFLMFNAEAEAKERQGAPAAIPHDIKAEWHNLVRTLIDTYRSNGATPRAVNVSPDVAVLFQDYENENIRHRQHQGDHRDLKPYVARWTENAWKIALVLHCAKNGKEAHDKHLDVSTAKDAIAIMRWFSGRQLELLANGRREKQRARLSALLAILAETGGEITLRDLSRSHSYDESEVTQLQESFPLYFRITTRRPASGRPSKVVSNLPADMES